MEPFATFEHKGRVLRLSSYEAGLPGSEGAWPPLTPGVGRPPLTPGAGRPPLTPGAGRFEIGQIELAEEDGGFALTAQIRGRHIAYVYTELLLKDRDLDRFYGPVAREHVRADRNKETRGITRPDWGDPVDVAVRIRPSLRLLTDGVDSAFCFSVPEGYDGLEYRLDGLYTIADGASPFRALLVFDSAGETKRVLAYREQGRRSMPRALTPRHGDQFTPFVQVLTPPADDGDWEVAVALSTSLVFPDQRLRVVTETLIPGDYLAGLVVQDLDGGLHRKYVPLSVGPSAGSDPTFAPTVSGPNGRRRAGTRGAL